MIEAAVVVKKELTGGNSVVIRVMCDSDDYIPGAKKYYISKALVISGKTRSFSALYGNEVAGIGTLSDAAAEIVQSAIAEAKAYAPYAAQEAKKISAEIESGKAAAEDAEINAIIDRQNGV